MSFSNLRLLQGSKYVTQIFSSFHNGVSVNEDQRVYEGGGMRDFGTCNTKCEWNANPNAHSSPREEVSTY